MSNLRKGSNDYFHTGVELYQEGDYESAINKFECCIKQNRLIYDCYYNIGTAYIKLNEYDKGIPFFKKAIGIKKEARCFFNLGACYFGNKNYTAALFNFILALKLDESDIDTKEAINTVTNKLINRIAN